MPGKQQVTRDMILDAAYARARAEGMASLSVRTIARDCGVSIGTIYNYFPDKASLVTEAAGRFWRAALEQASARAATPAGSVPGSLLAYCRDLVRGLGESLRDYRSGWLREISSLDARTRTRSQETEMALFRDIVQGIEGAIEGDPGITSAARARLGAPELARFIWQAIFEAIKAGDVECAVLMELLELSLYR